MWTNKVILGVGKGGTHVAVDPVSGEVIDDLGFRKRACTRLTACSDSFFVRGEGTLRFDRASKRVTVDGAAPGRPATTARCRPTGLLYLGPWQCDCNLSLIGRMARCSAGDFKFDYKATDADRLERFASADSARADDAADFEISDRDWPTLRGNNSRSSSTLTPVARKVKRLWEFAPPRGIYTDRTGGGRRSDLCGGRRRPRVGVPVRQRKTGVEPRHVRPIKAAPTVADGLVLAGSGNGYVSAVNATTGEPVWRFRAAPVERHIMTYGHMTSTWPVNSGVLVDGGTAYFAAGIIDHDGTYVYAVDSKTGSVKWSNNSSGHLNKDLRKGVSVQGNLAMHNGRLLLAGGNQVSPAPYDAKTGGCLAQPIQQGQPKTNNGRYAGVLGGRFPIVGGRILYSAAENVSTKGSFTVHADANRFTLNFGGIAPAWDDDSVALVNFRHGKLACCDMPKVLARIDKGYPDRNRQQRWRANLAAGLASDGAIRWETDLGESNKFEAVSLVVCPNAIVGAVKYQQKYRSQPQWYAVAFDRESGKPIWQHEIFGTPLPGGLLVDRDGRVVLTMVTGSVLCLGPA